MPFAGAHAQTTTGTAAGTLPTGGQVTAGAATISLPGNNKMQIDQASSKAILQWSSFSIGSGAWVNFTQPSASSIALNRVVGANPSEIFGRLTANGQVFLSNPSGVLFAPGASVDVGGLFATTLSISDSDFLAGRYNFANAGGAGSVVNQGVITATGYAALAGPQVRNDGVIVAQSGTVVLAAGDRVSLDMVGDGLISVSVDQAAMNASAVNAGTIQADGGRVVLTARSANALLDTVVNNSGIIRANSLVERNGEIVLDGGAAGVVANSGTLQAAGVDAGTQGGAITIGGDKVSVEGSGVVDASGDSGGGTVTIGRGASATFIGADTTIRADATRAGSGGTVETSGATLELDAAPQVGAGGTWLIDPFDIQIVGGIGTLNNTGGPSFAPTGEPSQIGASLIVNQLNAGGNVLVDTGPASPTGTPAGDIAVNASVIKTSVNAATLTLNAAHDVTVNSAVTVNSGGLTLNAGHDLNVNSQVSGANMSVTAGNAILLNAVAQDATLNSTGGQTINAAALTAHAESNHRALVQNTGGNQSVIVGAGGIDLDVSANGQGVAQIANNRGTTVNGTQTVSSGGLLKVVGGSTTTGSTNSGVFQNQGGKQTVSAGSISLTAANAAVNNGGALISNSAGGGEQEVDVAAGSITLKGGGIGLSNRAGITTNGNQTIGGNADISLQGGDSGIGTNAATPSTPANSSNAALISIGTTALGRIQNISAHNISLQAGSGGTDTFAAITNNSSVVTGNSQLITATGDVSITGGSNSGVSNGARIGAGAASAVGTSLKLSAQNVFLKGGATASAAVIGNTGSANTPNLPNNITITAGGEVTLNSGDGNGARIGAPGGDTGAGSISITAAGKIALNPDNATLASSIRTAGDVTLSAATVSEAPNGQILAGSLALTTLGDAALGGSNQIASFNASAGGDVLLNNTGALDVTGLSAFNATLTNAGPLTLSLAAPSFLPGELSVDTTGAGADLLVTGSVFAGGGVNADLAGALNIVAGAPGVLAGLSTGGAQNIAAAGLAVTAQNGGFASLNGGTQSITITGGSVDVQSFGGFATINAGGPQSIAVLNGEHFNVNGAGGFATVGTLAGSQAISLTGSGHNAITVGSTGALGGSQLFAANQSVKAGDTGEAGSISIVGAGANNVLAGFVTNPVPGGTQSISTSGEIHITGGNAPAQTPPFPAGIFHNGSGAQTITAGSITLDGGTGGNGNAAFISSNGGGVPANAGDQVVNVAGDLSLKAGSTGSANRAGLSSSGNQSITVGGDLTVTGGDGGGGKTSNGTSNGAFINAGNAARTQTISARNITLQAGSGGNDTFASITGATQFITASEDVRVSGGSNVFVDGSGARIGGLRSPAGPTNLTLKARDVILTGGSTAGSGAALGQSQEILQGQAIDIEASRDVILDSRAGAGARIGANSDQPAQAGDISIVAGRDIQLNGVDHPTTIRSSTNVTLSAGGAISEAPNGSIMAGSLTTRSVGSTLLGGANQVSVFNATSTAGSILLANTGTLQVTGFSASGDATLANAGDVTIGGAAASAPTLAVAGGNLSLASTGSVVVRASDTTGGAGSYLLAGGALGVQAGSFSLVGGAAPLAPAVAGGNVVNISTLGDFTLTGGTGAFSPALLLGGTGIDLTVGGTLSIDGNTSNGSFARVQTATRDGSIHITFTNASGDYVVDGLDGRIKHGQDGFYTGDLKPAKLGDTFFVTYE